MIFLLLEQHLLMVHRFAFPDIESGSCRWNIQVIVPAVINVVADAVLFIYPFPLIFMARLPRSLRYSLCGVFALFGLVTASAIVRVVLMTAGGFFEKADITQ
jgi:hypothetical protein